jgi:hypothetical protein
LKFENLVTLLQLAPLVGLLAMAEKIQNFKFLSSKSLWPKKLALVNCRCIKKVGKFHVDMFTSLENQIPSTLLITTLRLRRQPQNLYQSLFL